MQLLKQVIYICCKEVNFTFSCAILLLQIAAELNPWQTQCEISMGSLPNLHTLSAADRPPIARLFEVPRPVVRHHSVSTDLSTVARRHWSLEEPAVSDNSMSLN